MRLQVVLLAAFLLAATLCSNAGASDAGNAIPPSNEVAVNSHYLVRLYMHQVQPNIDVTLAVRICLNDSTVDSTTSSNAVVDQQCSTSSTSTTAMSTSTFSTASPGSSNTRVIAVRASTQNETTLVALSLGTVDKKGWSTTLSLSSKQMLYDVTVPSLTRLASNSVGTADVAIGNTTSTSSTTTVLLFVGFVVAMLAKQFNVSAKGNVSKAPSECYSTPAKRSLDFVRFNVADVDDDESSDDSDDAGVDHSAPPTSAADERNARFVAELGAFVERAMTLSAVQEDLSIDASSLQCFMFSS
jgi:hypothetical protein